MGRPTSIRAAAPGFMHMMRHFGPYLREHRTLLWGSFAGLFAAVFFKALEPWPLKFVFDYVLAPDPAAGPLYAWLENASPIQLLAMSAGLVIVTMSARAFFEYVYKVGFSLVGNRVLTAVRAALYRHIQLLSPSFHDRNRSGDLLIRVISDIGMLRDMAVTALMPLIASILVLVVMMILMFWMNWQLALVSIVTIPLYWLPTVRLSKRIQQVSRDQRHREGDMASTAAESIGAIRVVQALSLEGTFSKAFTGQNAGSMKEGVRGKRLAVRLESMVTVMIGISTALVLAYGAWLVMRGSLTAGGLLVFLAYLKSAFKPMQDFAKYTGRLAKATAAGERVIELLERKPDIMDAPGAKPAPALRGAIQFDRVSFAYEKGGRPILDQFTLTIPPGQTLALVGSSGAGKSTIANLLLRLYDPTEGRVGIDGHDIRAYTLHSLRTQIGVVLQDNLLFASSVRDNIAYGNPLADDAAIEAAARLANAHGFIGKLKEGYDTLVGERGVTLSAGQRQRIAIARAAVRNAPILILDEPTTGLDEQNRQDVILALRRLAKGRTTVLITHDLDLAANAHQILYLDQGRVAEHGTHDDLVALDGRYAALYRLQSMSMDRPEPAAAALS
ncbi:MAG: ABC transporter ATP-binding protein [Rhodothermales bacterium]|nr:ABC transporter ATP-binding protein [Rhodothermales bacterium]